MKHFEKTMHEIRDHYRHSSKPYKFKTPINQSNEPLPDDAIAAQNYFHLENSGFSNHQENYITNSSQNYIETKDYNDFKSKMEKNREEAKKRANAFIDEYTDKMIASGNSHPESQESITSIFSKSLEFFTEEVMIKIADFITELIDKIKKWIHTVIKNIEDTFFNLVKVIENFFDKI
ncbi:hypothetical protein GCM10008904_00330 [Paraclostridium ghonii]|uniref:Uncharacterized protein n=1 Tax=Paraclostridium ghonii TaxID=29358 RepID=A0ABU0MY88_9FIRM|nr:hypothetical protein [Paeniclostridium ghonii]MDQ0555862.1 hypothetical protein [Paeniclostridium ghonii]